VKVAAVWCGGEEKENSAPPQLLTGLEVNTGEKDASREKGLKEGGILKKTGSTPWAMIHAEKIWEGLKRHGLVAFRVGGVEEGKKFQGNVNKGPRRKSRGGNDLLLSADKKKGSGGEEEGKIGYSPQGRNVQNEKERGKGGKVSEKSQQWTT